MDEFKEESYFRFNSFGLSALAEKTLQSARFEIFRKFVRYSNICPEDLVLDVGVSAQDHPSSNFFEQYYPFKDKLTALGLGDFSELEKIYPGIKYVKGDGRKLPFAEKSFDWVFSHAVIEHVGKSANQESFLSELIRVSREGVFLTSPNRLHPIEFHTGFPLLHYLPKRVHLPIYKIMGQRFYCTENNLNLLFPGQFLARVEGAAERLGMQNRIRLKYDFVNWLGLPANIVCLISLS